MAQEREIVVWLENQPGNLAKIGTALKERNVNIHALFASEQKGRSPVHLMVDKLSDAMDALKALGIKTEERDVVTIELDNRPGTLAETAEKLAAEKINIDYAYYSTRPGDTRARLVLGVSDVSKAGTILK